MTNNAWQPVTLAEARARALTAVANDHAYRISIWQPQADPPERGFPSLWLLDGDALFATAIETIRRASRRAAVTGIAPMAVIGISHHDPDLYPNTLRQRDYSWCTPSASIQAAKTGGGPAFLGFIADELPSALNGALRLDPARRTLFGHSLAGLFVLHALAARPDAFHAWAAISPSIWWNPAALHTALQQASPGLQDAELLLGAGEWEATLPHWITPDHPGYATLLARRRERDMVGRLRHLAETLQHDGIGPSTLQIYPQRDHATVPTAAIIDTLRMACR